MGTRRRVMAAIGVVKLFMNTMQLGSAVVVTVPPNTSVTL
jgi:hypothetical protein